MICRTCGEDFDKKTIRRGFKDQCDDCAATEAEPPRALGFNDGSLNKSTSIAIYAGGDERIRAKIKNQKQRVGGF